MGVLMSRVMAAFGDKEARILVLGLDNAGKTTILYRLQVGAVLRQHAGWLIGRLDQLQQSAEQ